MEEQRLSRLESKIDRMDDAIGRLLESNARTETNIKNLGRLESRLDNHSNRLQLLERRAAAGNVGERALWLALSAAMAGAVAWFVKA